MKKIVVLIICLLCLGGMRVSAEDGYSENYNSFMDGAFNELLDEDTKQKLYSEGLNPESSDWVKNLKAQNVFSYIISLVSGGIKRPFTAFFCISGVIILISAFTSFSNQKYLVAAQMAAPAIVAALVTADVYTCVLAAGEAVRGCAAFMIGFIPAFLSLVAASGQTVTSAVSGVTLLAAANAVSSFAAYGVLPLMGGYLSISIASGVSPSLSKINPAETLKRITVWVLSLITTVFLGVLSIQTAVSSAADNLALKTAKFLLGTSVPVAGGALSEAVSAVSSSLSLLKNSVGIYAALVVAALLLPVVVEVILWRVAFSLSASVGALFGEEKISSLLKAVDAVFACILGVLLLSAALFIISLAVVTMAGKSV